MINSYNINIIIEIERENIINIMWKCKTIREA